MRGSSPHHPPNGEVKDMTNSTHYRIDVLLDACHMLHEQAHGTETAFRLCTAEPCRIISQDFYGVPVGPAQLSLLGVRS